MRILVWFQILVGMFLGELASEVLLDPIDYYLVEGFCIYAHQRYWSLIFFVVLVSLSSFWNEDDAGFIE